MSLLTPVLSAHWDEKDSFTIDAYKRNGGYQAAQKALAMDPDALIQLVKDSGLRGRGGAGFPTGMKWGFIPQGDNKEHYLVVNADESEPGTCKDMPLLMANPHVLVEGVIIAAYAIRAKHAFIYIRGEVTHVARRLNKAIADAYKAGYLGKNIFGTGHDVDLVLHIGAGAYICGEETALLDSLEGFRGQPRLRPPFPAIAGLYARPTVVNNVESISAVPAIVANGAEWYQSMGTEKSKGATLYSLSGHVNNPGQFEAPLGITLRQILDPTILPNQEQSLPAQKHWGIDDNIELTPEIRRDLGLPMFVERNRFFHSAEVGMYHPGRHQSFHPDSNFRLLDLMVFHFAYAPWNDDFISRKTQIASKLNPEDIERQWGIQHLRKLDALQADYAKIRQSAVDLMSHTYASRAISLAEAGFR